MLFRELPVGASFRFLGAVYRKDGRGGAVTNSSGKPDWIAGDNTVEPVDGKAADQAPPPVAVETPKPQAETPKSPQEKESPKAVKGVDGAGPQG